MTELSPIPLTDEPKPSDDRNGCFLDFMWSCKVCDGEIPDGHTDNCYIWQLEKKHRDFIANEYNAVLMERDSLERSLAAAEARNAALVLRLEGCRDDYVWLRDYGGQMNANCCNERIELIDAALTEQQPKEQP